MSMFASLGFHRGVHQIKCIVRTFCYYLSSLQIYVLSVSLWSLVTLLKGNHYIQNMASYIELEESTEKLKLTLAFTLCNFTALFKFLVHRLNLLLSDFCDEHFFFDIFCDEDYL